MSEKLTNDELYRKLLLEWFDRSKGHPLMGMGSLTATRHNELKHLIEQCRPADDKEAAGDITHAKLKYERPKKGYFVGEMGHEPLMPGKLAPGSLYMGIAFAKALSK